MNFVLCFLQSSLLLPEDLSRRIIIPNIIFNFIVLITQIPDVNTFLFKELFDVLNCTIVHIKWLSLFHCFDVSI